MPRRPRKRCRHPGCPELTDESYCQEHRADGKKYDSDRGTAAERGYGSAWQKIRALKLARDPLCEECLAKGIVKPAEQVHHEDENPHNNLKNNLKSLCVPCHLAKRGRGVKS
jgi:5-methylcytosine-specific restriction protein A